MQSLKKKIEGFTIIEVMIVLVIAAVIILIVFLAVPALQRNSRNNQRKNDVARIGAAITEVSNNNNGTLPTVWTAVSATAGNLGFYGSSVSYSTSADRNVDPNTAIIRNGRKCIVSGPNSATNVGTSAGSSRQFVILYAVETGSGTDDQCLQG